MPQEFPYKILRNDQYGRYMVASKNIKQGQLILKENPALVGPQLDGPKLCFNCCKNIANTGYIFCPICLVAVLCSPKCCGKLHTKEECTVMQTMNIKENFSTNNDQVIFPLRCLLLKKYKPELFEKIMLLEPHMDARRSTYIWRRHKLLVEKVLAEEELLQKEELDGELIQKICGILDVNTFEIRPPQNVPVTNPERQCLRGLYLEAAMISHSCLPNVHLSVDDSFTLSIHARVDIKENSPILLSYANVLQGTADRQQHLREGKYFECCCERCKDPTEFQTDISSMICHKCRKGTIRPNLHVSTGLKWSCVDCKREFKQFIIDLTVAEARRLIEEVDPTDIKALERLLKKLQKTFNQNHYLLLELVQQLVGRYSFLPPVKENLQRKIELCNHLLKVYSRLEPGISRIRAIALYELQSAMVDLSNKQYNNKEISLQKLVKQLESAEDILKESVTYLLYEPPNSPEGRVLQIAMSELKMLRDSTMNINKELSGSEDKDNAINRRLKEKLENSKNKNITDQKVVDSKDSESNFQVKNKNRSRRRNKK